MNLYKMTLDFSNGPNKKWLPHYQGACIVLAKDEKSARKEITKVRLSLIEWGPKDSDNKDTPANPWASEDLIHCELIYEHDKASSVQGARVLHPDIENLGRFDN